MWVLSLRILIRTFIWSWKENLRVVSKSGSKKTLFSLHFFILVLNVIEKGNKKKKYERVALSSDPHRKHWPSPPSPPTPPISYTLKIPILQSARQSPKAHGHMHYTTALIPMDLNPTTAHAVASAHPHMHVLISPTAHTHTRLFRPVLHPVSHPCKRLQRQPDFTAKTKLLVGHRHLGLKQKCA